MRPSKAAFLHLSFAVLWLLVVGISVYDGCWVLANRDVIAAAEQNPIGRLLIQWNQGDIWLLLLLKAVGTVLAATAMLVLYWSRPRMGWTACAAIACFQLGLLIYLVRVP